MKIAIIAVGRLKSGPERELCDRYSERFASIAKQCGFFEVRLMELTESPQRRPADRMADEAKHILAAIPADSRLVLLDERGKAPASDEFAGYLRTARDQGSAQMTFVIGGPDGLSDDIRKRADLIMSFGKLTIPHQIVRALLFEQLYRAATILTGHPYHRS